MTDESKLERDSIQWLAREAVRIGLESPLRESIVEAVEEATGEEFAESEAQGEADGGEEREDRDEREETDERDEETEDVEKSALVKAVQGAIVFVAMFTFLYVTLRWLTGDED